MEKPKKPIEPKPTDSKYPKDRKSMRDMTYEEAEKIPFIVDYKQYQKDMIQYKIDIELYEQIKLIRFVKHANEKLILRKYKIVKVK